MKIAVCTITYNEEQLIGAVLKNWQGKVYKHLVLHSDKPWHGQELPPDRTEQIVKSFSNAEFIRLPWKSEAEQRTWACAYLYDYDYVLMVDADELYTAKDQEIILNSLGVKNKYEDNQDCYRVAKVKTYFKSLDYILDPPDTHEPCLAINPKKVLFHDCRVPNTQYQIPLDVTMHHLTYLRDDLRMWHKIRQFEHFNQIKDNWFTEKWQKWTPEMEDVRCYGQEKSKAIYSPSPEEIKQLYGIQ